ncbi:hypothetical protein NLJ89_g9929 [Agrocybe chaxingu]|uniref:Uncharacterized protein n=1 Tax=Agrocybe chaxingu TaxID=84603 RepID=A0A9W8JZ39_9AGAR|nr:hypothetical protein NLJ89_g9929 [Agrocybe chaxingu]
MTAIATAAANAAASAVQTAAVPPPPPSPPTIVIIVSSDSEESEEAEASSTSSWSPSSESDSDSSMYVSGPESLPPTSASTSAPLADDEDMYVDEGPIAGPSTLAPVAGPSTLAPPAVAPSTQDLEDEDYPFSDMDFEMQEVVGALLEKHARDHQGGKGGSRGPI